MKKYNTEQLAAINTNSKHTALIAGAGTGKTTVLINRVKLLLETNNEEDLLIITFTKKASLEIKARLKNDKVSIHTFDSFCYKILNKPNIKIYESNTLFKNNKVLFFNLYDANLKVGIKPEDYDSYVRYKIENNLYDFNDIEYEALRIILENKITYKHILIDEFQDTNNLQFKVFTSLISEESSTFIVGDTDQSIYAFRGANYKLFETYIKMYNATVKVLTINYRSTQKIVESANNIIKHNKQRIDKVLVASNNNSGNVTTFAFKNEYLEYNYIIQFIKNSYNKNKSTAILFRNHEQGYLYKKQFYNNSKNVHVLSIHESKGLEFDIVYLVGVNSNLFPKLNGTTNLELEEERRVFFVAITRAKEELYVSYKINNKSKFIKELNTRGK